MHLERTLAGELPGILAWMVRGCVAWQKEGLGMPSIMTAAVDEYRDESDVMGKFIEECCVSRGNTQVKTSELYKAYRTYCEECSERYLSARDFPAELEQRGFKRHRTPSARMTLGIELKTALSLDARFGDDDKF
jgi:putative DNA primase/helicase